MQNRYVGDLGDFGKYGLLKALCATVPELRLGVVWYLVPDEGHNADGKYTSYLETANPNNEQFRMCDPALYDSLREMITVGDRKVKTIQDRDVLPPGTVYYDWPLTFVEQGSTKLGSLEMRISLRDTWQRGALDRMSACDVVFVDPDNGLEVRVKPHQRHGPKYAFFGDLYPYVQNEQSLVIYHHIGRRGSALDQIKQRFDQIKQRLDKDSFAFLYHRGSARAFFIVPSKKHWEILYERSMGLVNGPWARHFEFITPG